MITTYGARQMTKSEGMLRAFTITNLVRLDEETGDGRLLRSSGASTRDLPRTVFGGFAEGDGHGDNVVIGRLDAVEFDPESNTATGWGWLLDDENGRQAARYIASGAMTGNSIHMAEVEVTIEWGSDDPGDDDFFDYTVIFEKWSVASTTMLGIPAFKESQFSLDDDLVAAIYTNEAPLVVSADFDVTWDMHMADELMASDPGAAPAWEHFFRPEADRPTPIRVGERDEHGWYPVWGHLAQWNVCHDGIAGRCVVAPRPKDGFASFNASNVCTDKGFVATGPIFFKGGHPDTPLGENEAHKAYGGVENGWADVRAVEGVHGTWVSGVVRPNITDDVVYVARASRISGHWAGDGRLKAIVSVNTPGFDTPGRGESKVITDADGNVLEIVASFVGDCSPPPTAPVVITTSNVNYVSGTTAMVPTVISLTPSTDDVGAAAAALALLELEAEADAV